MKRELISLFKCHHIECGPALVERSFGGESCPGQPRPTFYLSLVNTSTMAIKIGDGHSRNDWLNTGLGTWPYRLL